VTGKPKISASRIQFLPDIDKLEQLGRDLRNIDLSTVKESIYTMHFQVQE